MSNDVTDRGGERPIDGRREGGPWANGPRGPAGEGAGAAARSAGRVDPGGWCGLAAGELEVAIRVAQRSLGSTDRLYQMTRHFVWLVPVINSLLFLVVGALCALAAWRWARRAGWLGLRLILVGAVLPALSLLGRGICRGPVGPRHGLGGLARPDTGAGPGRPSAVAPLVAAVAGGGGPDPGGMDRRRRDAQAMAGGGPPPSPPELAQRLAHRAGHRAGRPSERLRVRTADHAESRGPGPGRRPLRPGARGGTLDARLPRDVLHRAMAA